MDEDVLVLRLHHVVALRAQTRHVTIDIDRAHVLEALQHRVDHDERPRTADSRTSNEPQSAAAINKRFSLFYQIFKRLTLR